MTKQADKNVRGVSKTHVTHTKRATLIFDELLFTLILDHFDPILLFISRSRDRF